MKLMLFVLPIHTFYFRAPIVLLFWFGMDIARSVLGHGVLPAGGGSNFVVHAAGFLVGAAVAAFAFLHGTLGRYEGSAQGHPLFGYWVELARAQRRRPKPTRKR